MNFSIPHSIEILERTPRIIESMLKGISDEWAHSNEGPETWSPYDVVGHLIHGETTDWITRMELILSESENKKFKPFDRFAQFEESKGKTLEQLIEEFKAVRKKNIDHFKSKNITEEHLDRTGIHPSFGTVTLRQLLSTWVAHDLGHLGQISRVMAKRYTHDVGPWYEYLRILK